MPATTEFKVKQTEIPGLLEIEVSSIDDDRGYFQEKFQKEKLVTAGLPESFVPVQTNISYNKEAGTTRGIHAEPWDKYVSVVKGKVYGVYLDLRKENFGKTVAIELTPNKAVFVPRGVANSYQTLEPETYYIYFVSAHWSANGVYKSVNLADPALSMNWPIPIDQAIISEKDQKNPMLSEVEPF